MLRDSAIYYWPLLQYILVDAISSFFPFEYRLDKILFCGLRDCSGVPNRPSSFVFFTYQRFQAEMAFNHNQPILADELLILWGC